MENESQEVTNAPESPEPEFRGVIRETIEEYLDSERAKAEPAYKTELVEERRRREQLERRVNELVAENERSRTKAEETERSATIRDELRRLGVTKVDLAFKAVKDDVTRADDGRLIVKSDSGEAGLREYLTRFTEENPELLPARIPGGSGASGSGGGQAIQQGPINLDRIKPGMDPEQMQRVREEIAQAISQTIRNP